MLEILILCNKNTKDYNKFFANLIIKMENDMEYNQEKNIVEYLKNKIYNEYMKYNGKDFARIWLENITNKDAKLILFWIELYRQYKQRDYKDRTGLQYHFTLEHLMPQSWKANWSEIGIDDENAEKLIYQIGNMTLVRGALNASLKNKSWKDKLNGDGKVKNYLKKNADLLITRELFELETWDKKQIEQRTESLLNDFLEIWRINMFHSDF